MFYDFNSAVHGVVNVTEYGAVGGDINGSFMVNVTAMDSSDDPTWAISNVIGTFSVLRVADDSLE